ncbi:hypothetical protein HDU96_009378 [Phlyctochytrium bullatum]|nr:hypothetical protein HDU96_009378 [Phlyctochytrium bullatum]
MASRPEALLDDLEARPLLDLSDDRIGAPDLLPDMHNRRLVMGHRPAWSDSSGVDEALPDAAQASPTAGARSGWEDIVAEIENVLWDNGGVVEPVGVRMYGPKEKDEYKAALNPRLAMEEDVHILGRG